MGQHEIMLKAIMEMQQQQQVMSLYILKALQPQPQNIRDFDFMESSANGATAENVPNEVRTTLITSKRMSEPFRAKKMLHNIEKLHSPRVSYREAEKIARYLYDLKNSYIMLERSRSLLKLQYDKDFENIPQLDARAEIMEEKVANIAAMRGCAAELKVRRKNLHILERKRKRELDKEIERVEADIRVAENYFNSKYHIPLHDAPFEIKRIRKEARFKEAELERKNVRMAGIAKELDIIETEYRVQWEFANSRTDIDLIENLLSQMEKPHISARDNLRQVQIERTLDTNQNRHKRKS